MLNDVEHHVKFFLDRAFAGGLVGVHPNDNTATLWLRAEDLIRVVRDHGDEIEYIDL